ncbi:complement resistance protein TraT [Campylobacter sp. RM16188]|uniref:complement resistance protein TraT n=1 Tax=Campylobacter sp. RM16188 TaxID=1705725 RepID=UPI001553F0EC|nr:complement resistance protein TraT [Campylobacter sp. RM16188]
MKNGLFYIVLSSCLILFAGCAGGNSPETSVKMMQNIILPPVDSQNKTIYINSKNISGEEIDLQEYLTEGLKSKGYKIANTAEDAMFVLTASVVSFEKKRDAKNKKEDYGIGKAVKTETNSAVKQTNKSAADVVSNISSSFVDSIMDNFSSGMVYEMKVDILVSQNSKNKQIDKKTYTTGTANGSMKPQDAIKALESKIAKQIVGIF